MSYNHFITANKDVILITYTTIRIKKSTKEKLVQLVNKKEPIGDVIDRLLEDCKKRKSGGLSTDNNFR